MNEELRILCSKFCKKLFPSKDIVNIVCEELQQKPITGTFRRFDEFGKIVYERKM